MDAHDETHIAQVQGIIISGSPIEWVDINPQDILEKFTWLRETDKPVLGVCFGHQIIGQIFGGIFSHGVLIDCEEHIDLEHDELFEGIDSTFFQEHHVEAVSVPEDFVCIGRSCSCANEAMRHKEKPIWSVQFHPEISGAHGKKLLQNFCARCK